MKGQNQVVALSLLLMITVGVSSVVATQYNALINTQKQEEVVELELGDLTKETCWEENSNSKISIRNGQDVRLNTSRISTVVNSSVIDSWYSKKVVDPDDTLLINTTEDLSPEAEIKIVAGTGKKVSFSCPNF